MRPSQYDSERPLRLKKTDFGPNGIFFYMGSVKKWSFIEIYDQIFGIIQKTDLRPNKFIW